MQKLILPLLFFIALSLRASAQWAYFPAEFDSIPAAKLKGAVHTVLTIEQRADHVFATNVETYDKNGRLIERLQSNANLEPRSGRLMRLGRKTVFNYDSNGRLVRQTHFTPEGVFSGYTACLYDSKNFLLAEIEVDVNGKETAKTNYAYFPVKSEVEVKFAGIEAVLSYNEKNQWTKRRGSGSATNFEYDDNGNLLKADAGRYGHKYAYKFDKQGNWIERENTYFRFGDNEKAEEQPGWMNEYRIITYYSDNETKP